MFGKRKPKVYFRERKTKNKKTIVQIVDVTTDKVLANSIFLGTEAEIAHFKERVT